MAAAIELCRQNVLALWNVIWFGHDVSVIGKAFIWDLWIWHFLSPTVQRYFYSWNNNAFSASYLVSSCLYRVCLKGASQTEEWILQKSTSSVSRWLYFSLQIFSGWVFETIGFTVNRIHVFSCKLIWKICLSTKKRFPTLSCFSWAFVPITPKPTGVLTRLFTLDVTLLIL